MTGPPPREVEKAPEKTAQELAFAALLSKLENPETPAAAQPAGVVPASCFPIDNVLLLVEGT